MFIVYKIYNWFHVFNFDWFGYDNFKYGGMMTGYILSILGIVIAGVLIDVIMPSGKINKYIKSIYSNLLTSEFVKEGEEVEKGQTIGTVGESSMYEIVDESHLHFEILKNRGYAFSITSFLLLIKFMSFTNLIKSIFVTSL